jgi:hypothetical protein
LVVPYSSSVAASAAFTSNTAGRGVIRGVIAAAAARASARVGAATSASASSLCITRPPIGASAGWSSSISRIEFLPQMSADVTTVTCDQSNAGSRSKPSSTPCATCERTVAPCQASGASRSSRYSARPVTFATPSTRGTEVPTGGIAPGPVGRDSSRGRSISGSNPSERAE